MMKRTATENGIWVVAFGVSWVFGFYRHLDVVHSMRGTSSEWTSFDGTFDVALGAEHAEEAWTVAVAAVAQYRAWRKAKHL